MRARTICFRCLRAVIVETSPCRRSGCPTHARLPEGWRFNNDARRLEDRNPLYSRKRRAAWGPSQGVGRERRRGFCLSATRRAASRKMSLGRKDLLGLLRLRADAEAAALRELV